MALAVVSGIGGGGIIVPLLMVFYNLDTKNAVAVSGFTILTGSVCRYIFTAKEKNPDKDATCIEYGLSNVMLPTVLVGSIMGVIFNMILPALVLQILLTIILLLLSIQSGFKAREIYKKESAKIALEKQANNQDDEKAKLTSQDHTKVADNLGDDLDTNKNTSQEPGPSA